MILEPVTPRARLSLTDQAAARPRGLPAGAALKAALAEEVEELGKLQARLFADRRYAVLVVLHA